MVPPLAQVVDGAMATDGGSIALFLLDATGEKHSLLLTQRDLPGPPGAIELPGRLYFDHVLVGIRSDEEAALLGFLRTAPIAEPEASPTPARGPRLVVGEDLNDYLAAIDRGPDEALRWLIDAVVSYVVSDSYIRLAVNTRERPTG